MNAPVMMVQMDDHKWTLAALELACKDASARGGSVVLALLLPFVHRRHIRRLEHDLEANHHHLRTFEVAVG